MASSDYIEYISSPNTDKVDAIYEDIESTVQESKDVAKTDKSKAIAVIDDTHATDKSEKN